MLIRNTIFNLIGLGVPLVVAAVTIPKLVFGLGDARFGLLTLIWAVVSYFGLFDLGLGRALTLHLSREFATGGGGKVGPLVWTALAAMAVLGVFAGLVLAVFGVLGIDLIREVPDTAETRRAVWAMAVAMPFIVLTTGLRGILESTNSFGVINAIRLPMGLFTFVGPLVVLWISGPRLDVMAWVLAAGRVVACLVHAVYARRALGPAAARPSLHFGALRPLANSATWMTISNTVSPLMNYVDRFVIGAMVSASSVAWYATPHEMVTKLWILPGALTAVLFPQFSNQIAKKSVGARVTYRKSLVFLGLLLLPIVVALAIWAEALLAWWIDPAFAAQSAPVLMVLGFGMFATCLATIPYTVLQSAGQARLTAILHIIELPFYLVALYLLVASQGLVGAAFAWAIRNLVDGLLLGWFAESVMRGLTVPQGEAE
jgi:O-antigen/teichoic acid export membrane protein